MNVDWRRTLESIVQGGDYVALKEEISPGNNRISLIFYRAIDEKTHKEYLVAKEWRRLTFFQKIKYFFRTVDFSLQTINRVASEALTKKKNIDRVIGRRAEKSYHLKQGLFFLQQKITHANAPKWFHRVFRKTSSEIDMMVIKDAYDRLVLPPGKRIAGTCLTPPPVFTPATTVEDLKKEFGGRGLSNPGMLCYCNSSIKAMWDSPAFQRAISRLRSPLATALNNVFRELSDATKKGTTLSHKEGNMKVLMDEIGKIFPGVKRKYEQQDQHELFVALLDTLFASRKRPFFSLREINQRDHLDVNVVHGEIPKDREIERVEDLLKMAYISLIDRREKSHEPEHIVTIHPNADMLVQDVEDYFSSTVEEDLDLEAILHGEGNEWLSEKEHEKDLALLLEHVGAQKTISNLTFLRRNALVGNPPPFLPINIARFASRTEKNSNFVLAPYRLQVPVEGKAPATYALQGIVCHRGALKYGHYYNYFPWPKSPVGEDGRPVYWMLHSDTEVSTNPLKWGDIASEVASNATLYMYERIRG